MAKAKAPTNPPLAHPGDATRDASAQAQPLFDLLVCRGRLCTSAGSDRLFVELGRASQNAGAGRLRVRRGGCFGLCELSPNLVVRRYADALPEDEADLLTLSLEPNEWAYCTVEIDEVAAITESHLSDDAPYAPALRAQRERDNPPKNPVHARLRRLRDRLRRKGSAPTNADEATS